MPRLSRVVTATALLLALAACGEDTSPTAAPSTADPARSSSPATAAAAAPDVDAFAQQACKDNAAARDAQTNDDPAVMRPIAEAAQKSTNEDIALAGRFLAERVELAHAAIGASDEVTMSINLMTGSIEFSTACIQAGLVH